MIPPFLDRNLHPIRPGSRVIGYGQLSEDDRETPIFSGIVVWLPHAKDYEVVVEDWRLKGEPQTRMRVGATNFSYELQPKNP